MNTRLIILSLSLIFLTIPVVNGQTDCTKDLIHKIDSISKSKNIENGKIQFHRVTSLGDATSTDSYSLSRKQKFSFDGPFLIMGDNYYNMNKLLFFFIKEDYIEFYFQGY